MIEHTTSAAAPVLAPAALPPLLGALWRLLWAHRAAAAPGSGLPAQSGAGRRASPDRGAGRAGPSAVATRGVGRGGPARTSAARAGRRPLRHGGPLDAVAGAHDPAGAHGVQSGAL